MERSLKLQKNSINYSDASAYLKENLDVSDDEVNKIINFIDNLKKEKEEKSAIDKLTKRETEIFKLVANGTKTKTIANKLFISHTTVSTHRKKIKEKLQLNSILDWYLLSNQLSI